jgi:hypothetical protein
VESGAKEEVVTGREVGSLLGECVAIWLLVDFGRDVRTGVSLWAIIAESRIRSYSIIRCGRLSAGRVVINESRFFRRSPTVSPTGSGVIGPETRSPSFRRAAVSAGRSFSTVSIAATAVESDPVPAFA